MVSGNVAVSIRDVGKRVGKWKRSSSRDVIDVCFHKTIGHSISRYQVKVKGSSNKQNSEIEMLVAGEICNMTYALLRPFLARALKPTIHVVRF